MRQSSDEDNFSSTDASTRAVVALDHVPSNDLPLSMRVPQPSHIFS